MHRTRNALTVIAAFALLACLPAAALAQQAPPAEGDEATLLAVLQSDAPLFDKAKACQQLAVIGTKKAVPVLAKLLSDEQLAHYARFGLEPIPDPAVDEALREAAGKLQGGLLVGVINSIGMRRDVGAVDDLKRLMLVSDARVAAAASAALGRIATPEAVATLKAALKGAGSPLQPAAADACLTAADMLLASEKQAEAQALYDAMREADLPKHLELAALQGAIRTRGPAGLPLVVECLRSDDTALFRVALAAARDIPGDEVTGALVAELTKPLPAPETPPKVLAIIKAEYGAQDKWVDVTDQLAAAVMGNGIAVTASNALGGDPINGVVKELRVEYTLGGERRTATVPENDLFEIQGDMAQHPRQSLLIHVLGERGDQTAMPVVLRVAQSGPWDLRVSAVRALASLGDVSAVPVLLETAVEAQGELAEAARDSLAELPGEAVDAALARTLNQSEGDQLAVVIDLVGRRGIASAVPVLMKLADADDPQVQAAAIGALGLTVGLDELSALIDRLVRPKTPELGTATKEALSKACLRMPDRDACAGELLGSMRQASTEAKSDLLDLLGVLGGPKALEGVAAAAQSGNEEIEDAATRVLGEWMTPDAAPVLLDLAKTGSDRIKIRTLRGYIRIARQLDVPDAERVAMCRQTLAVARRDDEKKLALEVLGRYPSADSLAVAAACLDEAALKEAAAATCVTIAEKLVKTQPGPVAAAMKEVAEAAENAELAKRARALIRRAER